MFYQVMSRNTKRGSAPPKADMAKKLWQSGNGKKDGPLPRSGYQGAEAAE